MTSDRLWQQHHAESRLSLNDVVAVSSHLHGQSGLITLAHKHDAFTVTTPLVKGCSNGPSSCTSGVQALETWVDRAVRSYKHTGVSVIPYSIPSAFYCVWRKCLRLPGWPRHSNGWPLEPSCILRRDQRMECRVPRASCNTALTWQ